MRLKYSKLALLERLPISESDLSSFIDNGLLLPDSWEKMTSNEKLKSISAEFTNVVWSFFEVERFEQIRQIFARNNILFNRQTERRLDSIEAILIRDKYAIEKEFSNLRIKLNEISLFFQRKDLTIDADEFCKRTGYFKQYFHNQMKKVKNDDNLVCGYLDIEPYKELLWTRPGRKWQAQLIAFEEARKYFSYELNLAERKRKEKKQFSL